MISLSHSLLSAKIHVPALRQGLVPRKRLLEQLDLGLENRLTLISAPAGYGKTTLLRDWIANHGSDVKFAWLALDEEDNDPTIYLQYIIAALQVVDVEIGQSLLSALQAPTSPNPAGLLPPLLNQLNQQKIKIVLILDDYHLITEQAVHQITRQFIEEGATSLHVALATRADPPLPVHRYRAQGDLTELRQAQLSFTIDEAREFLLQTVGNFIQPEEIVFLHQRTEGWVVGLLLAGLSLREGGKVSASIAALSGNQNYIMEYLVNEVLDCQNERIRDFLLKTSILNRLTGSLCNRLLGFEDGYATLEWLKSKNLFISAVDDEQVWYRYHQLFADLLRRQLKRDNKDALPRLHKSASDWYAQNDFLIEAIDHAILSEDFAYAVALIEKYADKIWSRGDHPRLLWQLQTLPLEVIRSSVSVCLWYSLLLFFNRQYEQAKELMQNAEELVGDKPQLSEQYLNDVSGIKALQDAKFAVDGLDMSHAIQSANAALAHLQKQWTVPRMLAQMILADALAWQGNTIKASQAYADLLASSALQHNMYMYNTFAIRISFIDIARGRLREAYDFCLRQLQQLNELKPRLPGIEGFFHIDLAQILAEWNRLDETKTHLDSAYTIFEIGGKKTPEDFYSSMIRGYIACDQITRARQIIELVEQAIRASQLPRADLSLLLAWKAHIYLLEGHRSLAEEVLAELGLVDPAKITFSNEAAHLCLTRVWLERGEYQRAAQLLETLQVNTQQGGRTNRLIEVLILRAIAEAGQKHAQTAREYLIQSIALAEPEGFVRIFIEGGTVIYNILEEIVSTGYGTAYIHQLIEAFESLTKQPEGEQIGSIESFSERERQVLRLLRTHLSQQEMADQLCVSVNTIRFHIKNIYSKLDVHERSDAVRKAKEVGLL